MTKVGVLALHLWDVIREVFCYPQDAKQSSECSPPPPTHVSGLFWLPHRTRKVPPHLPDAKGDRWQWHPTPCFGSTGCWLESRLEFWWGCVPILFLELKPRAYWVDGLPFCSGLPQMPHFGWEKKKIIPWTHQHDLWGFLPFSVAGGLVIFLSISQMHINNPQNRKTWTVPLSPALPVTG